MAKTNAQYEIENDARTLVDAQIIRNDPKRLKAAAAHQEKVNKASQEAVKK